MTSLEWSDFVEQAKRISSSEEGQSISWKWIEKSGPFSHLPGTQYLASHSVVIELERVEPHRDLASVGGGSDDEEDDLLEIGADVEDDPATFKTDIVTKWVVKYYVCYSTVYSSPVLYFTVNTLAEGAPVPMSSVISGLALSDSVMGGENGWAFFSMAEHPALGFPCLSVHGCETNQMLECMFQACPEEGRVSYLRAWLSILSTVGILRDH